ncbi:helix-turn-helix domain-containing protein [Brevundimonas sp. VNH65]|uniref:helix-turn-helix domain-containing protein n=1 Tax=Brevundimonas sp. VNH65 TaxID=3400917 RepID=UPI003C074B7A
MSRSPDQTDAHIGRRIAQRRAALGLTQGGLAQRLGLSFQQVQKYESGTNRVSASRLVRIAALLGAPVSDFLPEPPSGGTPPDPDLARLTTAFARIGDAEVRSALTRLATALAA